MNKSKHILTSIKLMRLKCLSLKTEKGKKLLDRAITTWQQPKSKISNYKFGIFIFDSIIEEDIFTGCCLLGAASIGLKTDLQFISEDDDIKDLITKILDLKSEEVDEIIQVFDYQREPSSDLGRDVKNIRNIVFEEENDT